MSIEDLILDAITKPVARRGGVVFTLVGVPAFTYYKRKSIDNAVKRLQKKELITIESKKIVISAKGKHYLKTRSARLPVFQSPFTKQSKKNLIVMFDIPEHRKAEREWFRFQLKRFGYEMIQKSVWFGPSPLPKDFVLYVKSIDLARAIKTFTLSDSAVFD